MKRSIIIWIAAVFIVFNLTLVLVVVVGGNSTPPKVVLPNPNGYDDFVAAGIKVTTKVFDYRNMSVQPLVSLITNNTASLNLLRAGLGKECRVPIDYSTNFVTTHLAQALNAKPLAFLICAEGKLAELEGRTNDAAKSYLDGMRFGQEFCRGGLLITRMVGIACERAAGVPLESLVDSLDAQNCKAVARALESISEKEELVAETVRQEEQWSRSTGGFKGSLARLFAAKSMKQTMDAAVGKVNSNTLRRREMEIKFAARAYELEKGKKPQAVADLVPEYLKAAPKDPESGKELGLGW